MKIRAFLPIPRASEGQALLMRFLREFLRPYRFRLGLSIIGLVVIALTSFAQVRMIEPILDEGFFRGSFRTVLFYALAIALLSLVRAFAVFLQASQTGYVGSAMVRDIQAATYKHLITNDISLLQEDSTGKFVALLVATIGAIRNAMVRMLTVLFRDGIVAIAYLGNIFYTNWQLAIIALVFVLGFFPPLRWLSKRVRYYATRMQEEIGQTGKFLDESFKGIRHLKAYNAESTYTSYSLKTFHTLFRWGKSTLYAQAKAMPAIEILIGMAFASILIISGYQIQNGSTTIGSVLSFCVALLLLFQPVRSLINLNVEVQEGLAALNRLYEVLDRKAQIRDAPRAQILRVDKGDIEFRNVYFSYYSGKREKLAPALHDMTFRVAGGKKAALVGASGAGKSTLFSVLMRFYDIDRGAILIDGQNIVDVKMSSLRSRLAYVSQEVGIFNDSLRENVALGAAHVNERRLRRAIVEAEAEDFVSALPRGLDTVLGERGLRLSGGQLQRVALARALYKDAPILLLDEATSSLDNETEYALQQTLDRVMRKRTVLVIAHRLTTIRNADVTFVLDKGRCVEHGPHALLLKSDGIYARLWRRIEQSEQEQHARLASV